MNSTLPRVGAGKPGAAHSVHLATVTDAGLHVGARLVPGANLGRCTWNAGTEASFMLGCVVAAAPGTAVVIFATNRACHPGASASSEEARLRELNGESGEAPKDGEPQNQIAPESCHVSGLVHEVSPYILFIIEIETSVCGGQIFLDGKGNRNAETIFCPLKV